MVKDKSSDDKRLANVNCRVDKVHVSGLERTKQDVVRDIIREMFLSSNFQETVENAQKVKTKLEQLGCFQDVTIFIDNSSGKESTPNGLDVTFKLRELGRVVGGVTTSIDNNEGSMIIGCKTPNLLGRGERIQLEYSYGSRKTNNMHLNFFKPLAPASGGVDSSTSLFIKTSDWPWSKYQITERGFITDLSLTPNVHLKHNLQYELSWRELCVPAKDAAFEVRSQAGHTLKSSLRHILTYDTRDCPVFPTFGKLVSLTTELAGLGGDIGYLKNNLHFEYNLPIGQLKDVILQSTFQFGSIGKLFKSKDYNIEDRLFVGGPTEIRGFEARGVGPRSGGDAVGANIAWVTGLHLFAPLPFKPEKESFLDLVRLHFFTNFGHCDNFNNSSSCCWKSLLEGYRMSYGAGIAFRFGQIARVEFNFVIPQVYKNTDAIVPGLQFGVGIKFL